MIMQIGSINLMLLQALKDSSKYGLEIVKYVSDVTNGAMDVKQPSLYSGLNRLEKRGLISSYWQDSEIGGRRHYYTITELGLTQLKLHSAQIQNIMSGNIPEDDDDDDDNAQTKEDNVALINEDTTPTDEEIQDNLISDDDNLESTDLTDTFKDLSNLEQDNSPIDIDSILDMAEPKVELDTPQELDPTTNENITQESKEEIQSNNYGEYKPKSNTTHNKSFSQKMRSYVEPNNKYHEYEMQKPTQNNNFFDENSFKSFPDSSPNVEKINPTLNSHTENTIPSLEDKFINNRETTVEYIKQDSNKDIDYKNILGELDAELNYSTPTKNSPQNINSTEIIPEKVETTHNTPPKKSAYSTTLANILTTAKTINTPSSNSTKHHSNIGNQQRFDELNRKYDGCAELKCNSEITNENNIQPTLSAKKIESKKSGYSHIAQENITIKPYVKQDKKEQSDKSYLFINKFNLIRTFIMFVIMCLELGGMYWYFADSGILTTSSSANTIFIISVIIICMYVGLMLAFSVPNLQKIVLRTKISWKSDFFYRVLLTIIMIGFVIALNVFLGMSNFMDAEYLMQWLIPSVMIFNITLSGIVGYIMNLFKVQCK